jgi:hypothetical protein
MTEFDKETEDLVNCALTYKKHTGQPLYLSRHDLLKQWIRYAAHTEQATHGDVFNKLPYYLDTNMAPLDRKVA